LLSERNYSRTLFVLRVRLLLLLRKRFRLVNFSILVESAATCLISNCTGSCELGAVVCIAWMSTVVGWSTNLSAHSANFLRFAPSKINSISCMRVGMRCNHNIFNSPLVAFSSASAFISLSNCEGFFSPSSMPCRVFAIMISTTSGMTRQRVEKFLTSTTYRTYLI